MITVWCGNVYAANIDSWADLALTDSELVFSGDITAVGGQDAAITKSNITQTIDGAGYKLIGVSNSDSYNSFVVQGTATDLTLQNLTVTGFKSRMSFLRSISGKPNLTIKDTVFTDNSSEPYGGSIYFSNEGELKLENVQFNDNTTLASGGALWFSGKTNSRDTKAKLTMVGGQFKGNTAGYQGGAIHIQSSVNASFKDVLFENNHAQYGGAIYAGADNSGIPNNILSFDNVTFKGNCSEISSGGAINTSNRYTIDIKNSFFIENETQRNGMYGGALQISDGSSISIDNTQFIKNHTGTDTDDLSGGGAINLNTGTDMMLSNSVFDGNYSNDGGAINSSNSYNIYNTKFLNNKAIGGSGGAIWNGNGSGATIRNTVLLSSFENNTTTSLGGAMYIAFADTDLVDASFIGNKSEEIGGAIYAGAMNLNVSANHFENNTADAAGGAMFLEGTDADLIDTSFIGNKAGEGGAIYVAATQLNIFADKQDVAFSQNTASNDDGHTYNGGGAIYAEESTVNLNASEGKKIIFDDTVAAYAPSVININKSGLKYTKVTMDPAARSGGLQYNEVEIGNTGEIQFNNYVGDESGNVFDINLYDGKLSIGQNAANNAMIADRDSWMDGNNLTIYQGELNTVNDFVGNVTLNKLNINGPMKMFVDVDLANETMDRLKAETVEGDGQVEVASLNLLSDGTTPVTSVVYADANLRDYVTTSISEVTSKLYKYDVSYHDDGTFTFIRPADNGNDTPASFNPYAYEQSITLQYVSHLQKMINTLIFNDLPLSQLAGDLKQADPDKHIWMKMLAYDDDFHYRDLGTVDSKTAMVMAGVLSDEKEVGESIMQTNFYGGAVMSKNHYADVKNDDKGGFVGAEVRLRHQNWRYGANATGGLLRTHAKNSYGKDKYSSYWGGLSARVGYELALDSKTSLEPSIHVGWTAVMTDDFVSVSGLKSRADTLEIWDTAPNLKLTRMFTPGWLGYVQARYVFTGGNTGMPEFGDVALPDITAKNYAEYGVGTIFEKGIYDLEAAVYRRTGQREGWNGWLGLRVALP